MKDIEIAKAFFGNDLFATQQAGIEILEVTRAGDGPAVAKCRMEIRDHHMNANRIVMGGAIYTLADYTASIASNAGREIANTVSLAGQITYLHAARCRELIAYAVCPYDGKRTNFSEVTIIDEKGTLIAKATFNGYRVTM